MTLVFVILFDSSAFSQWYLRQLPDRPILEIRGDTADTTQLGDDRYVQDNLNYVLHDNEWVIVNFSAYWCPDSDDFLKHFQRVSALPAYAGIRWCYADVDGVRGNESFRERFALPGVPVVILFHNATIAASSDSTHAILDGHDGDKTFDDLVGLLKSFYAIHPDSVEVQRHGERR